MFLGRLVNGNITTDCILIHAKQLTHTSFVSSLRTTLQTNESMWRGMHDLSNIILNTLCVTLTYLLFSETKLVF